MRVASFGHSCLLVEAGSARILVDPGTFSAVPDDVVSAPLDAVLVTHAHPDHLDPALLGRIEAAHPNLAIYGSADIVASLSEAGIAATDHAFADFAVGGIAVEVLEAGHDAILGPGTPNAAYRISNELVITGDSTAVALDAWARTRVLALPTAAPWTTEVLAAALLERLRPEVAFPVHDGMYTDAFREKSRARYERFAAERDMCFVTLGSEPKEL